MIYILIGSALLLSAAAQPLEDDDFDVLSYAVGIWELDAE
jgi:hypothetical protein